MDISKLLKKSPEKGIIRFFHENPSSVDSPRGIATWIKEERHRVKRALDKLVKLGILTEHKGHSITGYSYTRDAKIIKEIDGLLKKAR